MVCVGRFELRIHTLAMPLESTYAQKVSEKTRRLANLAEDFPIDDAPFKQRLHLLFSQIEKEFESVFLENLSCK